MIENYDQYKKIVEENIIPMLPNIDSECFTLSESIRYSLESNGKRLRPVLLLAACEFAGGDIKDAIPFACAIEYIHTYSLIHDDLPAMDNDDLRRGKPTNHKVFGAGIATLAGDALLNEACLLMTRQVMMNMDNHDEMVKRIKAMYTIEKYSGVQGMIAGQAVDIDLENKSCSEEMLEYMHIHKTAALIIASVMAGLMLGKPDDDMKKNFYAYAENLGLAFQIADDILDVEGDPEKMGKSAGADKSSGKFTYISLKGIDEAREILNQRTEKAIQSIESYYDNAIFFRNLVRDLASRNR